MELLEAVKGFGDAAKAVAAEKGGKKVEKLY